MVTSKRKEYQANLAAVSGILQANPLQTPKTLARLVKKRGSGYQTRGHGIGFLQLELGIMLEQNPDLFSADRTDHVELWSVKQAKGAEGSAESGRMPKSYAELMTSRLKDFTQPCNSKPLIMAVLKEHGFDVRYEVLLRQVMARAEKEGFLPSTLGENLARHVLSSLLRRLENAKIIRLELMGEKIAPRDLSCLDDWENYSKAEKSDEPEPDFSDEDAIQAELERRDGCKIPETVIEENHNLEQPAKGTGRQSPSDPEEEQDEDSADVPDSSEVLPEEIRLALARLTKNANKELNLRED